MAQEITATASLAYTKGSIPTVSMVKSGSRFDVAGNNYERGTQTMGTGGVVAIGLGSVGTPGWCFIQNNDATNYVDVYDSTGGNAFVRLKPGEFFLGRLAATAPAARANTASVAIEYMIVEA